MSNIWETIYQGDTFDMIRVVDVHTNITQPEGTQDSTFVYNAKFFIAATDTTWTISIYPHFVPMNAFDINRFYAMCDSVHRHYSASVTLTHHGIVVDAASLGETQREVAAHILATLYHPHHENQWWKRFSAMRDYINFIIGGEILTYQASITPYYIDEHEGLIGLSSPYGNVLLGGNRHISPIYVKTVPYVTFPDAKHHFTEEEIARAEATEDVWIDNEGINVYVPQGDSALSVARAIKKVTSMRWIPFRDRYTIIAYEDKMDTIHVADVDSEMRFSPINERTLQPQRYVRPYNNGVDYTTSVALTKGAYRK